MTADRFQQILTTLLTREPFQPITIALKNGQRFEIDRADAVAYRGGVAGYLTGDGAPALFKHNEVEMISTASTQE